MDENELLKKYNGIYLDIIMKYREYIEEQENLYVAELPKLVTPSDDAVKALATTIASKFNEYIYEENFPDAANLAYEHVRDSIANITLPIQFWLRPGQALTHGAGDLFDKAVLLCSILIALGNPSSKIVIAIDDSTRHMSVYFEFNGRITAMDLEKGVGKFENRESMLRSLGISDKSEATAYEFNDKMYIDLT
jgi:hypothetical protein